MTVVGWAVIAGIRVVVAMKRLHPIVTRTANADQPPVGAVLGSDHPLVQAIAQLAVVGKQSLAVAAALVGSVVARCEGDAWATAMTVSAGTVLLVLAAIAMTLAQRKRERALDLILEGHERIPVTAVQRERRRLLARRTRRRLARTFETVIEEGTTARMLPSGNASPLFDTAMVSSVQSEIRRVIAALPMACSHARGVARAERVLTDARSPLHGHDPEVLRQELCSVRALLAA